MNIVVRFTVKNTDAEVLDLKVDSAAVMLSVLGYSFPRSGWITDKDVTGQAEPADWLGRVLVAQLLDPILQDGPGFDRARTLARLEQFRALADVAVARNIPVSWAPAHAHV